VEWFYLRKGQCEKSVFKRVGKNQKLIFVNGISPFLTLKMDLSIDF